MASDAARPPPPNRYARKTYSQLGEDMILAQIFGGMLKQATGFFVDVGAHHPWYLSNTALLYEQGWRGLSIDANPAAREDFERERPRDIFVASAVSREAGERDFYLFRPSAGSTLDPGTRDRFLKKGWTLTGTLRVPTMPLATLIARHVPPGTSIDYLNIDVEGMDLEVLETFDFAAHMPRCISIETNRRMIEDRKNPVRALLAARGYTFISHAVITSFFVKLS